MQVSNEILLRMRIPKVAWPATFEQVSLSLQPAIKKYIEDSKNMLEHGYGLFVEGAFGSGKTCAAVVVLKNIAAQLHTGLFVKAEAIPKYIIEPVAFDEEATMEQRMQSVELLVVDEVIYRGDRFPDQTLELVVRRRAEEMKSTIITTNQPPSLFAAKMPALHDVICGTMLQIKCTEASRRKDQQDVIKRIFA